MNSDNEISQLVDDLTYWGAVLAVAMLTAIGLFVFVALAIDWWF